MATPFKRSQTTERIVNYLRSLDKGALVSYKELSGLAEVKITPHRTTYARRILERDFAAVWICVRPHVGLRRLNDVEIAERLPKWFINGARRKLSNGGKQAEVVEMKQLDIDQQARFGVDCVRRELALNALSRSMQKRMEKVARGTSNDLPAFNIVEWQIALTPRSPK